MSARSNGAPRSMTRVESQGSGKRSGACPARPGAHSQEMRVRSLLATLDCFEDQRPAFTRDGDVYPERRLNRAQASKRHMLVKEHGDGMLKAIPGGSADSWTAGVILKLAGSREDSYFENIVRPGGRRAPSASSARTSASQSRSAPHQLSKTKSSAREEDPGHRCIVGMSIATKSNGKEDYGDAATTSAPATKRLKKPMSGSRVLEVMATLSKPLTREELLEAARKSQGKSTAPQAEAQPVSSLIAAASSSPPPPVVFTHVAEKGRADAASKGAYFAGYSFAG